MGRVKYAIEKGSVFGRLTTIEENRSHIKCLCECGNTSVVKRYHLISGNTRSCGCVKKWVLGNSKRTHGRANSRVKGYADRTYGIWQGMRQRCSNPKHSHYKSYGGRGVKVCEEWDNSFEKFVEDMGSAPEGLSIDRIDVDGDYCQENCVWATAEEQALNFRRSTIYEIAGSRKTVGGWAKEWAVWWASAKHVLDEMLKDGEAAIIDKQQLVAERKAFKMGKVKV